MAKKAYIGVDGKARKIKKGYIGVDGVARKIKKAYIGIGGGATYREVEYLESSGTQYIDTGVYPSKTTQVDVTIKPNTSYMSEHSVLGSDWSLNGFFLMFYQNMIRFHSCGASVDVTGFNSSGKNVISCSPSQLSVNGTVYSLSGTGSDANYPIRLFSVYNEGGYSSKRGHFSLYSCQIYDNGNLIRDYVPCISPDGTAGLFDKVSKHFCGNAGSGSFVAGAETGATYISNGVARPCWSGGELAYYGAVPENMGTARRFLGAGAVGDYAIFVGGLNSNSDQQTVADAYSSSLVKTTVSTVSGKRAYCEGASAGDYVFFAGSMNSSTNTTVNTYNKALTRSTTTALQKGRGKLAATSIGDYAVFGGGDFTGSTMSVHVDAYNSSGARTTGTNLSKGRYNLAATTVGDYALFGGGGGVSSGDYYDTVDTYTSGLTKGVATALSVARVELEAATTGNYALFAGGCNKSGDLVATVDAYDVNLTRTTAPNLTGTRYRFAATSIGEYAVFSGGMVDATGTYSRQADAYDSFLTRTKFTMGAIKTEHAGTTVGNYALFGGGATSGSSSSVQKTVLAFTVV